MLKELKIILRSYAAIEHFKKIFLDTSPLIYLFDKESPLCPKAEKIFDMILNESDAEIITSVVTCAEYLVHPYIKNHVEAINIFWKFLEECDTDIRNIDIKTAIKAAKIRAEYSHFKTPDALQLSAAILSGCDLFLTNDKQLKQFAEIKCVTVEEWL